MCKKKVIEQDNFPWFAHTHQFSECSTHEIDHYICIFNEWPHDIATGAQFVVTLLILHIRIDYALATQAVCVVHTRLSREFICNVYINHFQAKLIYLK